MRFIREIGLPYPQPWEYVISNILDNKKNGVFVDVGAYDGNIVSNTLYLEDCLGWSGICIEPNPNAFTKLKENRLSKCINVGISDTESEMDFCRVTGYAEMLSGFIDYLSEEHKNRIQREIDKTNGTVELIRVKTKLLCTIFDEYDVKYIDYLSVDTEGNELRVLKSIDYDKCYIKVISVENNDNSDDVKNFIESKGFQFTAKICGDDIYINNKQLI